MNEKTITIGRTPYGEQPQQIDTKSVSRRHAILTPLGNNKWELEDVSTYGTIVDGLPIIKTVVGPDTPIVLANDFSTSVRELLALGGKAASVVSKDEKKPEKTPKEVQGEVISVAHLEDVYTEYRDAVKNMVKKRSKAQILRMLPMQLVMPVGVGMSCILINDSETGNIIKGVIMVGVMGLTSLLSLRQLSISSNQADEQSDLMEKFQIDYVCPKCKNFFGQNRPYKALLNQGRCPYCKSVFIEATQE